jgi:hypothetical protein
LMAILALINIANALVMRISMFIPVKPILDPQLLHYIGLKLLSFKLMGFKI